MSLIITIPSIGEIKNFVAASYNESADFIATNYPHAKNAVINGFNRSWVWIKDFTQNNPILVVAVINTLICSSYSLFVGLMAKCCNKFNAGDQSRLLANVAFGAVFVSANIGIYLITGIALKALLIGMAIGLSVGWIVNSLHKLYHDNQVEIINERSRQIIELIERTEFTEEGRDSVRLKLPSSWNYNYSPFDPRGARFKRLSLTQLKQAMRAFELTIANGEYNRT